MIIKVVSRNSTWNLWDTRWLNYDQSKKTVNFLTRDTHMMSQCVTIIIIITMLWNNTCFLSKDNGHHTQPLIWGTESTHSHNTWNTWNMTWDGKMAFNSSYRELILILSEKVFLGIQQAISLFELFLTMIFFCLQLI